MEAISKRIKEGATECTMNDILFPVEIRDEEMSSNSEYCKRVVGQIDGADFLLNQCSNRYELVPNANIFPKVEKVLNANGIAFDAVYSHINNVRFYADYVITDPRYIYRMSGTNDVIEPMLKVRHSYNGLTKYAINFGYFRLVCTNGLVIAIQEMKEFNLQIVGKHTDSIKKSFEKLDQMLKYFSTNASKVTNAITDKYELLGGVWIADPAKRLKEVLHASGIIAVENNKFNTVNDLLSRISAEANRPGLGYNGRVNDWLVYNAINQYVNDDNRNIAVPEKRMEVDSKVFEYMLATA